MFHRHPKLAAPCRLMLLPGEVYRVPPTCHTLQVLSGTAWVTYGSQDILVQPGDQMQLGSSNNFALVSPLGDEVLVIETRTANTAKLMVPSSRAPRKVIKSPAGCVS